MESQLEIDQDDAVRREVLVDVKAAMLASASTMFPGSLAIPLVYWWTANQIGLAVGMVVALLISVPTTRYLRNLEVRSHEDPQRVLSLANFAANGSWGLLPILMMPQQPEHQYLVLALPFAMLVANLASTAADRRVYLAGHLPLTAGAIIAFAVFADGTTRWAAAVIAVTALTLDGLASTWRKTVQRNAELQRNNDRLVQHLASNNVVLKHLSEHDDLTGLFNRRALTDYINDPDTAANLAVMLVDLDSFKEVNDAHGHQFGDEILKLVATRLRASVDDNAKLGRLGGDEFAVVWSQHPGAEKLHEVAARINHQIRTPFALCGVRVHISASIGVAVLGESKGDAAELLRQADLALYKAKDLGRDQAVIDDAVDTDGPVMREHPRSA